ncbi:MAG: DNA-processing protein DprA [Candidatus Moraniibacteriota bacterium]
MADNNQYAHAFLHIENIGSETLKTLATHFGGLKNAWLASPEEIQAIPKIHQRKKDALITGRKNIDPEKEWATFLTQGRALITLDDPTFPALLREIPDAPYTLYAEGNFDWTKPVPMIAIVGSRKFTAYGEQVATKLAEDLTRAGFLVVSGLAFGIDSVSHEAAMGAGGQTIAVLGNGLDQISPPSHLSLAKKIMGHGAVVSEYYPRLEGNKWSFPARNRIIAGMTLGTVVIEAADGSGSLITAQCALEYNREVFAVPGSIFSPYSIGTNALIKRGAKLVTGIQDILEELNETTLPVSKHQTPTRDIPGLSKEEQTLLSALTHEPLHVDKIIKATTLETAIVSSILSLLEIKGLAKNVGGMHYIRIL